MNNIIWAKCPKSVFVERRVLEIGVSSAVLEFNESALLYMKSFNILMSRLAVLHTNLWTKRINNGQITSKENVLLKSKIEGRSSEASRKDTLT